jgi:hypothetical protein
MPNTAFTVGFVVGVVLLVTMVEKWPERLSDMLGKSRDVLWEARILLHKIGKENYNFGRAENHVTKWLRPN